ncbi:tyrosine-protein phosphatase non-receptor type substrate 1-like [Malaclemys terrapin pileata]|uniref:tyrosine-protein phosphatase non-receptor type substrate 1-like n=1 Tax=Malaclemys terrapin pileata TaxID=2991368 RepID=UPI0023A8CA0E|nr:tyrosine-protein phosphatase non-receptor type substrate 1-like [Malaclemys terrapin pileata]
MKRAFPVLDPMQNSHWISEPGRSCAYGTGLTGLQPTALQMAFRTSVQLQLLSLLLGLSSLDKSGAGAQEFQLLQPQGAVSVSEGENLTLICSVTGNAPVGPVKWFKGSGSGQLVYAQVGSFPRVTRAVNSSDTDFTIHISDTRPEDAGIYRCVKFVKGSGDDEEFRSGAGTVVSVSSSVSSGYSQGSAVAAAACTVCVLLVVLLLVFTYFFVRKKRGRSPGTARSQTPFPKNRRTQSQPGESKDPDVLYADLQHTARLQQPKKSAPEEHSEYAAVKVTQAIAR